MIRNYEEIFDEVINSMRTVSSESFAAKINAAANIKCAEIVAEAIRDRSDMDSTVRKLEEKIRQIEDKMEARAKNKRRTNEIRAYGRQFA